MKQKLTFLARWMMGATLLAYPAHAQIDYSGLEEVFGEPVTISATGKPQRVSEVPVSMEIISRREIQESGALDIPALLRNVAGVEVARPYIGHADVNIRGYNQSLSNRLLVLVNGRQVYQDQYGMTIWQSLPITLNEIRQIEVIRGPNSSLYGFNASSGVVNIVTDSPLADDNSTYQVRVGTQRYREFSGMETLSFNESAAVRMSGSVTRSDDFDRSSTFGLAARDGDAIDRYSFNFDGEFEISPATNMRVETGMGTAALDLNLPFNLTGASDTRQRHYSVDVNHDAGDWGLWNLRAYRNESNFKAATDSFGSVTIQPLAGTLHVVQLSDLIALNNKNTLRLGVEYRDNEVQGELIGSGEGRYQMKIAAANAMWNWEISPKLSWTNAGRVDHWQTKRFGGLNTVETINPISLEGREETEFTFNSGLLYKADQATSYRFSVGRGIRIPSLVELSQNAIVNGIVEAYGDPMLEPESNLTFEIGYNRLLQTEPTHTEFFTNLYTQQLDDIIMGTVYGLSTSPGVFPETSFGNVGDSRAWGLEMGLKGKALQNNLHWGINYAYITINDDPQSGPQMMMEHESNQPHHKVNAMVQYDYDRWDFGLNANYVSGRDSVRQVTVEFIGDPMQWGDQESYLLLGGNVGYQLQENMHLSLDGYNLIDEHNERQPFITSGNAFGGGNRLGRTVLLTLTARF